jgi:hypothetical protein
MRRNSSVTNLISTDGHNDQSSISGRHRDSSLRHHEQILLFSVSYSIGRGTSLPWNRRHSSPPNINIQFYSLQQKNIQIKQTYERITDWGVGGS